MDKDIIIPVIPFIDIGDDEDHIDVEKMVKLFETELTRITKCPITLDWTGLQLL